MGWVEKKSAPSGWNHLDLSQLPKAEIRPGFNNYYPDDVNGRNVLNFPDRFGTFEARRHNGIISRDRNGKLIVFKSEYFSGAENLSGDFYANCRKGAASLFLESTYIRRLAAAKVSSSPFLIEAVFRHVSPLSNRGPFRELQTQMGR